MQREAQRTWPRTPLRVRGSHRPLSAPPAAPACPLEDAAAPTPRSGQLAPQCRDHGRLRGDKVTPRHVALVVPVAASRRRGRGCQCDRDGTMMPTGCRLICGPLASPALGQEGSNVANEEGFSAPRLASWSESTSRRSRGARDVGGSQPSPCRRRRDTDHHGLIGGREVASIPARVRPGGSPGRNRCY